MDVMLILLYPDVDHKGMLYTSDFLNPRLSLIGQRNLDIFLGGRVTDLMLCWDSTLLTQFRIDLV
jgi:hypothetical protein